MVSENVLIRSHLLSSFSHSLPSLLVKANSVNFLCAWPHRSPSAESKSREIRRPCSVSQTSQSVDFSYQDGMYHDEMYISIQNIAVVQCHSVRRFCPHFKCLRNSMLPNKQFLRSYINHCCAQNKTLHFFFFFFLHRV